MRTGDSLLDRRVRGILPDLPKQLGVALRQAGQPVRVQLPQGGIVLCSGWLLRRRRRRRCCRVGAWHRSHATCVRGDQQLSATRSVDPRAHRSRHDDLAPPARDRARAARTIQHTGIYYELQLSLRILTLTLTFSGLLFTKEYKIITNIHVLILITKLHIYAYTCTLL
eukprot:COSAG02_NODE_5110_length_4620_cov_1.897810_4_plen_168_part_00